MIYAMHSSKTGLFKIGMSQSRRHALRRAQAVSRSVRAKVELLLWVDWPYTEEQRIHRYLWESWVRGEWFKPSDRLREVLGYLEHNQYLAWLEAFRSVERTLPAAWHYLGRDKRLAKFKDGQNTPTI